MSHALLGAVQMLIEGYLKPMRAHDWDKGSLYSFRTMSFPNFVPYDSITPPVLVITGEKDIMLTKSAKQVPACAACIAMWQSNHSSIVM